MMTVPKPDPRALKVMVKEAAGAALVIAIAGVCIVVLGLSISLYVKWVGGFLYSIFPNLPWARRGGTTAFGVLSLVCIMFTVVWSVMWYYSAKGRATGAENDV